MTLVVHTVVLPGNKAHEGVLVESVGIVWKDLSRLFQAEPNLTYQRWLRHGISPPGWQSLCLTE
jgi:hypothetical protein